MNGVMRSLYDAAKHWMRLDIPIPRSFVGAYLEWSLLRDLLKTYQLDFCRDIKNKAYLTN